jgi:FkbM family methyltransferase
MGLLINHLPITQIKLFCGRILYSILHLIYREDRRIITRNGIKYEVDLSEGIDLSVFAFGKFQGNVSDNKHISLPEDAVVFDVGANFGIMALQYAKAVSSGKVYAFEPTYYAFSKLKRNLELNPELAKRIVTVQSFVSSRTCKETNIKAYASWKVGGAVENGRHSIHRGTIKSTEGIGKLSLDDFCVENKIGRLDFIKIDTDGHEYEVLKGAQKVITKFKPIVIFEVGLYVMEENNIDFSIYLNYFGSLGYSLFTSGNIKKIDAANYRRCIPSKGTTDILAIYREDRS